ncbi:antibiotic biosynthesis monooxygenase family protein [Methylobacterium planeticum]|uniref:Antibiotic biosynthesis monooxygenase n=1 Tax=Methylobacterium planeticum TaxID=2615211 RepID=A0A6N6MU82_9HYPH|nr:antibiotic biosynthesis monooxygenase [Methylobacterium planeticum]KAB1073972.1 antibiotic biosynthesis monooxygenase [Methylobacterium planeticum]
MFSVIFEVHPGTGQKDAYLEHAKVLKPELAAIDGFIDNERFASRTRPGWVLSHSTWRDEKSVIRWRTHAGHHLIQEKGRFEVFSDYHLRVGEVTTDSHPPQGHAVREQRLDATEIGRAKMCQLCEVTPREGQSLPDDLAGALGLDAAAVGLVASDLFNSIYNSGKAMLLLSWADSDAASAFAPLAPPQAESTRVRRVRVIRDYGMFDRRESPQFYPPVDRGDDR